MQRDTCAPADVADSTSAAPAAFGPSYGWQAFVTAVAGHLKRPLHPWTQRSALQASLAVRRRAGLCLVVGTERTRAAPDGFARWSFGKHMQRGASIGTHTVRAATSGRD